MTGFEIIPPTHQSVSVFADNRRGVEHAIGLWLARSASPNTRRAYRRELETFSESLGLPLIEGLEQFLAATDAQAHAVVDAYRAKRLHAGNSPSTINRSMAALNSFVSSARRHGFTTLRLEAEGVASRKYRDTRGPGTPGIKKLIAEARNQRDKCKAARDEAILRCLFALGLRRAELVECDLAHLDIAGAVLSIKGKGETERRTLSLPPIAITSLQAWLERRGDEPGPLFQNHDRQRMSGAGLYHLIRVLGVRTGVRARPHGIRHAAITAVLDATNGDMRKAQAFGRHASASTTVAYDDNRTDQSGAASRLLDALVE